MKVILFSASLLALSGCGDLQIIWESLAGSADKSLLGEYQEIPGDDASQYLAPSIGDSETNMDGVLAGLDFAASREAVKNQVALGLLSRSAQGSPLSISAETSAFLRKNQRHKIDFKDSPFERIDEDVLGLQPDGVGLGRYEPERFANDTVSWTHGTDSFLVSNMDKIPVKNQGQRGTCSAFAGVGHMEAFLIKKYTLSGIDLSEQRFYFMSRPDLWDTGGALGNGGSNAGTGFARSNGYNYQGVTYPPGSDATYNLPLEASCPYEKSPGSNELQAPQTTSCEGGVAKVEDFSAWVYQWGSSPYTAQEIYNYLLSEDLPVVIGTKLTSNWERNDGMITKAGVNQVGNTSHAVGHAYLIVGARKLSESEFPNEGGMCFVIKNSWGKGWGVNGYSCMTLAWFNDWRLTGTLPVVSDMNLDTTKFAEAKVAVNNKPDGLQDPDANSRRYVNGRVVQLPPRKGTARFLHSGPRATSDMSMGSLMASDDQVYKILYQKTDVQLVLQGLLRDQSQLTHELTLAVEGDQVMYEDAELSGVQVGTVDTATHRVVLCAEEFQNVCHLNYIDSSNEMVIGLTRAKALHEDSEGPFDWQTFQYFGYGIELSRPSGLNSKLDVRLLQDDEPTEPKRFLVKPTNGNILHQGKTVGNALDLDVCSGDYSDRCQVATTESDFDVLFVEAP